MISSFASKAQELIQMTVHSGESFYVHPEANVSVFSDLNNAGIIGTFNSSTINFLGQRWSNRRGSFINDESRNGQTGIGGTIKFSGSTEQYISTQTSSQVNTGFPNITLTNSKNLILEGSDLLVRRTFNFQRGLVFLNNRNAVFLSTSNITGYNVNNYFVTGTSTSGGALIRKTNGIQQSQIDFPVGTKVGSYTPASISYIGLAQDLKVRVFDNVYDKGTFGNPDVDNFVSKTWNVAFSTLDPKANMTLYLQHNAAEESSSFASERDKSVVGKFETKNEKWDFLKPSGFSAGIISSGGAVVPNAYVSTLTIAGAVEFNEFYSKAVDKTNVLANYRVPVGISPNDDGLNDKFVIENLKSTDKVRIDIYNKWQSLVYREYDYKNTFEGIGNQQNLMNSKLPDGTYYYILTFNDSKPITGYIIINR